MTTHPTILAVETDGDDGLIVTFSDGTSDGYVVEELLELRPHRPPVGFGAGSSHDDEAQRPEVIPAAS
jgi:hypothetical protein